MPEPNLRRIKRRNRAPCPKQKPKRWSPLPRELGGSTCLPSIYPVCVPKTLKPTIMVMKSAKDSA
jgi:hypothetical protein